MSLNIAIQFSGLPRWKKGIVQTQFSQMIIPAGARVDVFMGLWRVADFDYTEMPNETFEIFGSMALVNVLDDFNPPIPPQATEMAGESKPINIYKMHRAIDFANELRTTSEKQTGRRYDVVIRTRPDLILSRSIDIGLYAEIARHCMVLPLNNNWRGGFNDQFAIANPKDMNYYCAMYDKLNGYAMAGAWMHPERLLRRHLEEGGLSPVYGNFKSAICRITS